MDYYTIISRDNTVLVKMLLEEIKQSGIKSLNNWDVCYRIGIDGYLVNIVYNIIINDGIYKKEDIDTKFDIVLKPIYKETTRLSDEQFYDIFNTIWNRVFQVDPFEYRFIKTLAFRNQPIWRKTVNSNGFMIFVAVLLLVSSSILGGAGSFISMLFILCFGSFHVEKYGIIKTYTITFIAGCVISFFLGILELDMNVDKYFILSFMLSLLMIPVLIINKDRIKETESEREKYYRKMNNVK